MFVKALPGVEVFKNYCVIVQNKYYEATKHFVRYLSVLNC